MSLTNFETVFTPSKEVSALHFYGKVSKDIKEAIFSRPDVGANSGATVFNSDGDLVELAENDPDWDFPIGGGCPHLMLRPQVDNILQGSNNPGFSGGPSNSVWWSFTQITYQTGLNLLASGDAFKLIPSAVSSDHTAAIRTYDGFQDGGSNTVLIYAKADGYNYLGFNSSSNYPRFNVNLLTGAVTNIGGPVADSIETSILADGTCRIKVTFTASGTSGYLFMAVKETNTAGYSEVFTGDGTKGVLFSHITIGKGIIDHPIPNNTTSNLTRAANYFEFTDLVSKGVIGAGGDFSFLLDFKFPSNNGTDDTSLLRFQNVSSTTLLELIGTSGGAEAYWKAGATTLGTSQSFATRKKIAFAISGSTITISYNGGTIALNASLGGSLAITKLVTAIINGWAIDLNVMAFTPSALSEAQLNAATA